MGRKLLQNWHHGRLGEPSLVGACIAVTRSLLKIDGQWDTWANETLVVSRQQPDSSQQQCRPSDLATQIGRRHAADAAVQWHSREGLDGPSPARGQNRMDEGIAPQ
jgi:hypothetical protein